MVFLWIMAVYLILCLVVLIKGPAVWDRLLGLNLISAKVVIIIMLAASVFDSAYLLDFAVAYALLGFIGTVFTAHFIMERIKTQESAGAETAAGRPGGKDGFDGINR